MFCLRLVWRNKRINEKQEDRDNREREEEQHSTIPFTPKQFEVLLKMNRLNFIGLVEAFKGRSI
jgi:hypothetical protein